MTEKIVIFMTLLMMYLAYGVLLEMAFKKLLHKKPHLKDKVIHLLVESKGDLVPKKGKVMSKIAEEVEKEIGHMVKYLERI